MKKLLSKLFWKTACRLIKWSVKLEPLATPVQSQAAYEPCTYTVLYHLKDGRIVPADGPITVEEAKN